MVAETEAPWGEAAENVRAQYGGFIQQAASDGYAVEGRKTARSMATILWHKLMGTKPEKKKPPKASSFARG